MTITINDVCWAAYPNTITPLTYSSIQKKRKDDALSDSASISAALSSFITVSDNVCVLSGC